MRNGCLPLGCIETDSDGMIQPLGAPGRFAGRSARWTSPFEGIHITYNHDCMQYVFYSDFAAQKDASKRPLRLPALRFPLGRDGNGVAIRRKGIGREAENSENRCASRVAFKEVSNGVSRMGEDLPRVAPVADCRCAKHWREPEIDPRRVEPHRAPGCRLFTCTSVLTDPETSFRATRLRPCRQGGDTGWSQELLGKQAGNRARFIWSMIRVPSRAQLSGDASTAPATRTGRWRRKRRSTLSV